MPFTMDGEVISLDGHCPIEEAQPLFDALRGVDEPIFDVSSSLSDLDRQTILVNDRRLWAE